MIEIDCDNDDFNSGSILSMWDKDHFEMEQQLYAQMMGWA